MLFFSLAYEKLFAVLYLTSVLFCNLTMSLCCSMALKSGEERLKEMEAEMAL